MADDELTGLMSLTPDVLNSFCMLFCLVIREERPPLTLNSLVLDQTSTSRSVWHHYDVTGVAEHFLSIRRHIQSNVQKRVTLSGGGIGLPAVSGLSPHLLSSVHRWSTHAQTASSLEIIFHSSGLGVIKTKKNVPETIVHLSKLIIVFFMWSYVDAYKKRISWRKIRFRQTNIWKRKEILRFNVHLSFCIETTFLRMTSSLFYFEASRRKLCAVL